MNRPLPSRITVSIGELALRGFPADQQHRITRDLEAALGHLLADPQVAAELTGAGSQRGLKLALPSAPAPEGAASIGSRAAAAIVQGLRR